jgi:hypothetical protein
VKNRRRTAISHPDAIVDLRGPRPRDLKADVKRCCDRASSQVDKRPASGRRIWRIDG